jgi:predicted helicase
LSGSTLETIKFEEIKPNDRNDWINQSNDSFRSLLPIADKGTKTTRIKAQEQSIFKLFVSGIKTNRDEWAYDLSRKGEKLKSDFFEKFLLSQIKRARTGIFDTAIKWSRDLKAKVGSPRFSYDPPQIVESNWRPWTKRWFAASKTMNDIYYDSHHQVFGKDLSTENRAINIFGTSAMKPFQLLATNSICDYEFVEKSNIYPRFRFSEAGEKIDNLTDWALEQFQNHYKLLDSPKRPITKDAIFYYVYGVLHDTIYREKYALNLKRELPRIPLYADFWKWVGWGERLMVLHIGYEKVEPWPLERSDTPDEKSHKAGLAPKAMLKADKENGNIRLDSETQLTGVPLEAWAYRLGNRSALEWILDQYKEKTPKDPTIREKFYTYRFADHKEKVVDLLRRVTRVSVETMQIVDAMRAEKR